MPIRNLMMERIARKYYSDTIVHWAKTGKDAYGPTFDSPVEITGRWEDRQELVRDGMGNQVLSSAVVFTGTVLSLGDYVYLGDLDDISSSDPGPADNSNTREVIVSGSVRGRGTTRLRRFHLK